MPGAATFLPARRPELVIRAVGERGRHVVKDPCTGSYYTLGEQETFLLTQLDGEHTAEDVCRPLPTGSTNRSRKRTSSSS